jgi:preprotein translocase SecY subunit
MRLIDKLKAYFTNKEIIKRVLVTLFILLVFRLLSKVPAPGIERDALEQLFGSAGPNQASIFNIANVIAGSTLSQFSIISVGLVAFISSSVIFQLLPPLIPAIEQLQKMGETGRKVIDQWTRILAVPLAGIQAFGIYMVLKSANNSFGRPLVEDLSNIRVAGLIAVLIAGTMLLIWLAELCSQHGLGGPRGGGVGIIITAGILASVPTSIVRAFSDFTTSDYLRNFWAAFGVEWLLFAAILVVALGLIWIAKYISKVQTPSSKIVLIGAYTVLLIAIPTVIGFIIKADYEWTRQVRTIWDANIARLDTVETRFGFFLGLTLQIIAITTFFNESIRRIPIKFISRIRTGARQSIESMSYLPLKLLSVGVMPIIFASSMLLMPEVIYRFFGEQIRNWNPSIGRFLEYASQGWLNQITSPYYHILHFMLAVLFSLLFITIVMKAEDIANDLRGRKTFIPGVRPGEETVNFLSDVIMKVTFWGGLVLATISILPYLFGLYNSSTPLGIESFIAGGTSVLIVVPTVLAVKTQLDAMVLTKNYERFEEI